MTPKMRRRRRELLDIPFEFDVTMDEILEDLFHPNPLRPDPHAAERRADGLPLEVRPL